MLKYRKYIIFWFVFILLYGVIEYPQYFGLEALALDIKNTFLLENKDITVSKYHLAEQPTTITKINNSLKSGEYSWITKYVGGGEPGYDKSNYRVSYDSFFGDIISYDYVGIDENYIAMQPNYYQQGASVEVGSFFTASLSRYGVNCVGCTGEETGYGVFSVGVGINLAKGIKQYNGSWLPGITYEGYYILATDPAIPLCTIVEFTDHNISGLTINSGEPFYAVVLDRGGAIKGNRVDFYIGDEDNYQSLIKYTGAARAKVTIVAFGTRVGRSCKVPDINSLP